MDVEKLRDGDVGEWVRSVPIGGMFKRSKVRTWKVKDVNLSITWNGTVSLRNSRVKLVSNGQTDIVLGTVFIEEFIAIDPSIAPDKDEVSRLKAILAESANAVRGAMAGVGCHASSELPGCISNLVNDLNKCKAELFECINAREHCDEIKSLKKRLNDWEESSEAAHAILNKLPGERVLGATACIRIERLAKERDEAREELDECKKAITGDGMPALKGETSYGKIGILPGIFQSLRKERDEARSESRSRKNEYDFLLEKNDTQAETVRHYRNLSDDVREELKTLQAAWDAKKDNPKSMTGYVGTISVACAEALAAADSQYQYLIDNNCIEDTPKAIEDWAAKCKDSILDATVASGNDIADAKKWRQYKKHVERIGRIYHNSEPPKFLKTLEGKDFIR